MTTISKAPVKALFIALFALAVTTVSNPAQADNRKGGAKKQKTANANVKKRAGLYWYPVDPVTNQTTGSFTHNDTKANVINDQGCKDQTGQPICLYGSTSSSVAVGTTIPSTTPASNKILRSN
jgi:hypothetical protein